MLQAGIIAIVAGLLLRHVPATAHASWWPYVLFAYAFLAGTLPWLLGSYDEDEFHPAMSVKSGVIFALPLFLAARWLAPTPYHLIAVGCWAMVALWGVHLVASLALLVKRRVRR